MDLISRQTAIDALGEEPLVWNEDDAGEVAERNRWKRDVAAIKALPSAEQHGRWIKHPWGGGVHTCSVCGKRANIILANGYLTGDASPSGETGGYYHYDRKELLSNYCPNCGAKMK